MPIAVVTGGATGAGLAIAERLLDDGWKVALIDTDSAALAEAEELLRGEEVVFLTADVTDEDEIADAFDQVVDLLGPLSALINTTSRKREAPFEETSAEMFRESLEVNLVGPFIAAEAALDRMDDGFSVINLVSVSGLRATSGSTAFSAAQAGVKMMAEVMALELGSRGVRVNCVAVGLMESSSPFIHDAERQRPWLDRTPLGRLPSMREVTAAVAYLLSPEAASITGHTLVIDGGFSAAGLLRED